MEGKYMQQQGDVLMKEVSKLPKGAKKKDRKNGSIILAEGEVTGHAHRIRDYGAELYERDDTLYLKVDNPVTITHEEHHAQKINKGTYQIGIVQEYDYFEKVSRRVAD